MRLKYGHWQITMTLNQNMSPSCIVRRAGKKRGTFCWGWSSGWSSEAGALAPVFEKLATELKDKQKLLKCKSSIATFNIRTLNRIDQQLQLTASAVEYNKHIFANKNSEVEIKYPDTGNGWKFVSSSARKNSVNAVLDGIRILLSPHTLKSLYINEKIQIRIMVTS